MRNKVAKLFTASTEEMAKKAPAKGRRKGGAGAMKHILRSAPFSPSSSPTLEDNLKHIKKPSAGFSSQVLQQLKKSECKKSGSWEVQNNGSTTGEVTKGIYSLLKASISDETLKATSCDVIGDSNTLTSNRTIDLSWSSSNCDYSEPQRKKEVSRMRKKKFLFKGLDSYLFTKLVKSCASKFGPRATLEVFDRFGRQASAKDYNALINLCINEARESGDENSSYHVDNVYRLFTSMRERGFQIEEDSFGPFFEYLIDKQMERVFQFFSEFIREANPTSYCRVGYYEMLLWIRAGNEDKIEELSSLSGVADGDRYDLSVSYLLAFCDSDRKDKLPELLEVVDIPHISERKHLSTIFKSLGRLQFENFMEKFTLALKASGDGDASSLIYYYASNIPNMTVEEIISKFRNLHEQHGLSPTIDACDMLIKLCCISSKVRLSMDVLDFICQCGVDIPDNFFDSLLHACEQSYEFDMVVPVYSVMQRHNLKPRESTFKSMISSCVRMKDFESAYKLLTDAKEMGVSTIASLYNAIMAGYFKEKNSGGALMVLQQMKGADIQPDSETYSYLISNSECEEDICKYLEECSGVEKTKHFYMALINAFAKFGNFESAKQVVLDCEMKFKCSNEIKGALISALASNGQISDALRVYDELKLSGYSIDPKPIINLIEHTKAEGELDRLLQLLEELNGSSSWFDGCSRVVLYAAQNNHLNPAIELLKKLKEKDEACTSCVIDQIFSQIWQAERTNLEIGMDLFCAIKTELKLDLSRTSLDFLLSSCVKAKDLHQAKLVWNEYEKVGLPYNILTYLRMYQAFLAAGARKKASKLLKDIAMDDRHVKHIVKSCSAIIQPSNT